MSTAAIVALVVFGLGLLVFASILVAFGKKGGR